jgi:hypothetical protein
MYNFILSANFGEDYEQKWIDGIFPRNIVNSFNPGSYNTVKYQNYNFHNLVNDNPNVTIFVRIEPNSLFNGQNDIRVTHIDSARIFILNESKNKIWAYLSKGDSAWLASSNDMELLKWNNEFCFNKYITHSKIAGIKSNLEFSSLTNNSFKFPFIISLKDTSYRIDPIVDIITGKIIEGEIKTFEIYSHFYCDLNNNIFKFIYRDSIDFEAVISGNILLKTVKYSLKPGFTKTSYLSPFFVDNYQVYFKKKIATYGAFSDYAYSCDVNNIKEFNWTPIFKEIHLADFKKYNISSSSSVIDTYFHKISENKFVSDNLILEKGETINKVPETEKKDVYMYKYLPYPQPGTNQINVKIYTNNFDCFNPKTFEVYNSNGLIISNENEFEIVQTGIYEAEIVWDCSKQQSGVYFIKLNCETYNDVIKVIKN